MNRRIFLQAIVSTLALFGIKIPQAKGIDYSKIDGAEARWGTYGKNGDQPLRWVKLKDCETDHLQAILETQINLDKGYKQTIQEILQARNAPVPEFSLDKCRQWMNRLSGFARWNILNGGQK